MEKKTAIKVGLLVGSIAGGYIPAALWGAGVFPFSSVICSAIGATLGVYLGYKWGW
jgi:phage tail tape-measure protein